MKAHTRGNFLVYEVKQVNKGTQGGNSMTETEFEDLIFDMENKWTSMFEKGKHDEAWKILMDAWDLLPEPKYKHPMSWWVVIGFVKYGIETKQFDYAEKFLGILFICDLDRADSDEREFLAGRLAYAKGDIDIAKELFARSLEKGGSCGCMMQKENRIYKELVQGKRKTAKSKSKLPADKLIDKADEALNKGKYEEAEELYLQGLDKIDDFESDEIERYYRNAYAGLGDCCFWKKEYENAKNYYFDAYNYDYSNPYINMCIGKCFVFLQDEKNAKEYLMRAYSMAGEGIFRGNEPLFDIIKDMI